MNFNNKSGGKALSDEEIIELYWQRNEEAITATDYKYRKYLYTIAYNIINDNQECEECLNDTYMNTWNSIPPARPQIFHAFLSRIMRNVAMDRFKHNSAQRRVPAELIVSLGELEECIDGGATPEEELAIKEVADILSDYLRSLPRRKMVIFICRYYYSDKISEIAEMLETSESTVSRELSLLRNGLYEKMKEKGVMQ